MIVAQAPQTGKDLETVIANVQNPDRNQPATALEHFEASNIKLHGE